MIPPSLEKDPGRLEHLDLPVMTDGQLRDAVENLRDGFLLYDRHERVVFHNRRLIELYPVLEAIAPLRGRSMAELIEAVGPMLATERFAEEAAARIAQRRAEWSQSAGTPYTLVLKDGRRILVGERAAANGGRVVVHTDVTAEKQAEMRLVEAIESLHNGFVLFDADDRLVLANEPLRRMFPAQAAIMVPGAHIDDIVRAGVEGGDYRNFGELGRSDAGQADLAEGEFEAIYRRHREGVRDGIERQLRDGRWIVVHQAVTPSGLRVGLRTDVTLLKERERELAAAHADLQRMAEELRLARERAEAADRAKTEFLAIVGHELRTPFTGIRGMADLLADAPLGPEHRRYLDAMRRSTASLLEMLDQILDFSQVELGRIERYDAAFDPAALAVESVALFQALALEKGLGLRVAPARGLPASVVGDEGKTRQILLNLLSNAVKFTDSGSVTVSAALVPDPRADGQLLRYEVADTGIGMSPEATASLFQPFRQLDSRRPRGRGGSGLGLAICKRLANALGGDVSVASAVGEGTRFWFTVAVQPADRATGEQGAPPETEMAAPTPDARRVLVVEDDTTSRLLVSALLTQWGYAVVEAGDGGAALAALAAERFAAVLMDVHLPVLDGPGAVRCLRAGSGPNRAVPVIGLSGESNAARLADCAAAGFSWMLGKPFDLPVLRAAVARAVAEGAAV
ncbi:hypothetical protein STVA_01040 [Allostella vacuolata]|nr:hypothetical protein STVA_01040 [Stella vacuolata]